MAEDTRKTRKEPVFDTDKAWGRFKEQAVREPAPAFWRLTEDAQSIDEAASNVRMDGNSHNQVKDGVADMKQTEVSQVTQEAPMIGATGILSAARDNKADGVWRTERPSRRRLRRLTTGVAAAVVAVSLFATPLGDWALAAMQQTFRIQHMVGIGITADDMATISDVLDRGSPEGDRSFSLAQYGTINQSGGGESHTITWDEAKKRMGPLLLQLENSADPSYQPATTLTLNLNVDAVNRLLTRLGSTTTLPAEADGKTIQLHIPDGITTEGTWSGKPVRLLQFGKPELTVEDGIDPTTIREAVLGLPVLPDSLRTKLAAIHDWQSTLPVPARDGVTTSLRLGGHDAVMTVNGKNRYLFWLNGERMGLLSGALKDFPAESAFLKAAEELILP
jgi:hypothetical protein